MKRSPLQKGSWVVRRFEYSQFQGQIANSETSPLELCLRGAFFWEKDLLLLSWCFLFSLRRIVGDVTVRVRDPRLFSQRAHSSHPDKSVRREKRTSTQKQVVSSKWAQQCTWPAQVWRSSRSLSWWWFFLSWPSRSGPLCDFTSFEPLVGMTPSCWQRW